LRRKILDKKKYRYRSAAVLLMAIVLVVAMCMTYTVALAAAPAGPVTWYIAEGSTAFTLGGTSFQTFIALNNPGAAATVNLTYMIATGPVAGPTVNMPAGSAAMVDVGATDAVSNQWSVATQVTCSTQYVSAEDQVYYNGPVTQAGSNVIATTSSIGTTQPATSWYLAEGSTGIDTSVAHPGKFETFIEVQNTSATTAANVSLTYLTPNGSVPGPQNVSVPANARQTWNVADTKAVSNQWSVSTTVTSDQPVVAERSTYWDNQDPKTKTYVRAEGTGSIGATATAGEWYLPEGSTGITPQGVDINPLAGNFETWILVQNPDPLQSVTFALNFLTPTGTIKGPQAETLAPGSRQTYDVSKYVPNQFSVATQVLVAGYTPGQVPPPGFRGVVAERALYWTAGVGATAIYRQAAAGSIGWSTAMQSSAGQGQATTDWEVDGCRTNTDATTKASYESWILVMAPLENTAAAAVTITYQKPDGTKIVGQTASLAPGTRQSFRVNDVANNLDDVAAVVSCTTAGQNIMVEHSTYYSTNALPVPTSNRNNAMDTICTNGTMAGH
jgi:hypothetical protein